MGVYRRKIGKQKSESWYARFTYRGKLHRRGGFPEQDAAQHWMDSTRMALRRGELGYVKAHGAARVAPLIEQYADHLRTLKRADKYAETAENRLNILAGACPWMTIADFTAASFDGWRASGPRYKKKLLKPKTLNQYLDQAQYFGDWLVSPMKLLPSNPMKDVAHQNVLPNDSYRRAATLEELNKLLDNAPPRRAMIYKFLIYIPLRRRAMKSIEWRDLVLDGERPTFTLRAELAKNGRVARLAIRQDLADALRAFRGDAADDDLVFGHIPSIETLQRDLKAAGVEFDDGKGGRRLDLHAFRKTVVRLLKKAGVSMDEVHIFLQHRDRRTTERYYDDDLVAPEIAVAAERMPAMGSGAKVDTRSQSQDSRAK